MTIIEQKILQTHCKQYASIPDVIWYMSTLIMVKELHNWNKNMSQHSEYVSEMLGHGTKWHVVYLHTVCYVFAMCLQ